MGKLITTKRKEGLAQLLYSVGGNLIYCLGFNLLIVPMGFYSGGFMGVSQLAGLFLTQGLHLPIPPEANITGIIYFAINVPLLYLGYRMLGKEFAVKTLIMTGMMSAFLVVIPIPKVPYVEDYLTACIIGGIVCGLGSGLVLRGRSSAGGQDIIGLCCAKKFPNFSVGKVTIIMNIRAITFARLTPVSASPQRLPTRACLKHGNMPKRRLFFRHALPIFLEIHPVFLRQIGFVWRKNFSPLGIVPFFKQRLNPPQIRMIPLQTLPAANIAGGGTPSESV